MKKRKREPLPPNPSDIRARIEQLGAEARAAGMSIVIKHKPIRKRKMASYPPGSAPAVFRTWMEKIEADAKAVGGNLTILCKLARISRAGPTRWVNDIPMTIKTMWKMERALQKLIEKYNKARTEGPETID